MSDPMQEVHRSLGRIEAGVDAIKATISDDKNYARGLSKRLRAVEQKQYWFSGFASLIGFAGGWFLHKP